MTTDAGFGEFLTRVRQGDEQAAQEFVERYGPHIQRIVRVRLTDARLRRQMDSLDVCQSVLREFFFRVTMGQFDLDSPDALIALLAEMARNKLINRTKYHRAARRDMARQVSISDSTRSIPDRGSTPSVLVARAELLQACRRLLSEEELRLAEARADGRGWNELAAEFGTTADALRKRHARALDRVAKSLGIEGGDAL